MTSKINGILLINKPQGKTSNAVLQEVKRLYNAKKAGHTGSLDPLATGMLPICFGEATKFSQYLLDADKCYEVTGKLGIKTNTADSTGDEIARVENFEVSKARLREVITKFIGKSSQVPSMFSALKHQGQPLYKLARKGIEVERKARDINIHEIILNHFDCTSFSLTVTCSKGTYIRNLVEDIGDKLGVGAHVTKLHRCYTLGFANDPMYHIDELKTIDYCEQIKRLLPLDRALVEFPELALTDLEVQEIRHGRSLAKGSTGLVCMYDNNKQFIGLGEYHQNGELRAKRLMSVSYKART